MLPTNQETNRYTKRNTKRIYTCIHTFEPDFHGASIVLENGIEIPITDEMVRESLQKILDQQASKQK